MSEAGERYLRGRGVEATRVLNGLPPTEPDPAIAPTRLEVVDESTLRIAETNGYGSMGERLVYDRADDGTIRAVRSGSGILATPLDRYRAAAGRARRVTSAHPLRG